MASTWVHVDAFPTPTTPTVRVVTRGQAKQVEAHDSLVVEVEEREQASPKAPDLFTNKHSHTYTATVNPTDVVPDPLPYPEDASVQAVGKGWQSLLL